MTQQTVARKIMRSDGVLQTYHVKLDTLDLEAIQAKLPDFSSNTPWIGPLSVNPTETMELINQKRNGMVSNKNSFFMISFSNSKNGEILFEMQRDQMGELLGNISSESREQIYDPNGNPFWVRMKQNESGVGIYYSNTIDGADEELHTQLSEPEFDELVEKNIATLAQGAVDDIIEAELETAIDDILGDQEEIIPTNEVPFHQEHLAYSALPDNPPTAPLEETEILEETEVLDENNTATAPIPIPGPKLQALDFLDSIPSENTISTYAYDAEIDQAGTILRFMPEGIEISSAAQQSAVNTLFLPVHIKSQMQTPNLPRAKKMRMTKDLIAAKLDAAKFRRMHRRRVMYAAIKEASLVSYPKSARVVFAVADQMGRLNAWRIRRNAARKWKKKEGIERQKQLWRQAMHDHQVGIVTRKSGRAQGGASAAVKQGIRKARRVFKI